MYSKIDILQLLQRLYSDLKRETGSAPIVRKGLECLLTCCISMGDRKCQNDPFLSLHICVRVCTRLSDWPHAVDSQRSACAYLPTSRILFTCFKYATFNISLLCHVSNATLLL